MNDKLSKKFFTKKLKKQLTPNELEKTTILQNFLSNFSYERKFCNSYGGEIILRLSRTYGRDLIYKDSYDHIYACYNGTRELSVKEKFLLQLYL